MKKFFFLLIAFIISIDLSAQNKEDAEIIKTLNAQSEAWNRGDIQQFMEPYWHSDSLIFVGKSGVTYGWENTLKNYQKGYPDTASMGKLHFDIIQTKRLSAIYYSVVGKWHLTRSIGDIGGHFTLLLRKIKNKWVIVSDHSS